MNVLKKLYGGDSGEWGTSLHSFKAEEFEIIDTLSKDYDIKMLCSLMGVSRAGYYKWRDRAYRRGDREQYIEGLEDIIALLKGRSEKTVLHTDQGSVYASMAYNELIKDTLIVRSMSRAGKPTDNPVNEALNGWIKEELVIDFQIETLRSREEVRDCIEKYVTFYNESRPCFAIGYDTPANYRRRYYKGELEVKDTFSGRQLSEVPKFVQKRRKEVDNQEN